MTVAVGLLVVLALSVPPILLVYVMVHQADVYDWCSQRLADRRARRARRGLRLVPEGRPIEDIAGDVRRLGRRIEQAGRGVSFAKYQALRHAYDGVLMEGCRALDIPQRLEQLPDGDVRDLERRNVEFLLEQAGLRLKDIA